APTISASVASPAPSAIGRKGGSSPAIPSLRAYSIPVSMPSAWSVFTAGMFRLCSIALRSGIGPGDLKSEFLGAHTRLFHGFGNEIGASTITVAGVQPIFSIAAEYTTGLNAEPTWRMAWVARLNLLVSKS